MSPEVEAEKRRLLRNWKLRATSLLVIMAVIYLACTWWLHTHAGGATPNTGPNTFAWWLGLFRTGSEAGMVGGLADWFAVTALFRYPMGIPIPHTALVPNKKDQIGDELSKFVGENFLHAQAITEKIEEANIPQQVGAWLAKPDNAEKVSAEIGRLTANAVRAADRADAEALINSQFLSRAVEPEWAPPLGRLLEGLIDDGKIEPIVDEVVGWARKKVAGMEDSVVKLIDEKMPRWAPRFAKDLVGERVYRELVSFMADVDTNPNHDARVAVRRTIAQFAQDLQHDPAMIARIEQIKGDVMGSPAMASAAGSIWDQVSQALIDAAEDPDSVLRRKITETCKRWGGRINTDPQVRAQLDRRIEATARFLVDNYGDTITGLISENIQRWDGKEASEKIELLVGKDLQFIRINGSVVGALVGVLIYIVTQALF
nr:DUF445 family protein [Corynebacterium aquatimens]